MIEMRKGDRTTRVCRMTRISASVYVYVDKEAGGHILEKMPEIAQDTLKELSCCACVPVYVCIYMCM
jgi:hypothetical protein